MELEGIHHFIVNQWCTGIDLIVYTVYDQPSNGSSTKNWKSVQYIYAALAIKIKATGLAGYLFRLIPSTTHSYVKEKYLNYLSFPGPLLNGIV